MKTPRGNTDYYELQAAQERIRFLEDQTPGGTAA
jgi:hypothetical protein